MRDRARKLLACLCLAACCPCCFPCYICAIRSSKRRRRRHEEEEVAEVLRLGPRSPDVVRPLRMTRRRRISLPPCVVVRRKGELGEKDGGSEEEVGGGQKGGEEEVVDEKSAEIVRDMTEEEMPTTYTQAQSLLFQRLPPEVRALIWRECVGDYTIFLGQDKEKKRMHHWKLIDGRGFLNHTLASEAEQNELMRSLNFMPLLQTCRRIYTEAIPHVYSSNTFLLTHPSTLLSLSATTLSHRFTAIRHLSILYTPSLQHGLSFGPSPPDMRAWSLCAALLASMSHLQSLDIVFSDRSLYGAPSLWGEKLGEILGGLERVRGVRGAFRVCLRQDAGYEVDELSQSLGGKDVPFELRESWDQEERFFWLV